MNNFWAGGFLFNPKTNSILLHKRDSKTLFNPNKWAFFGGLSKGQETPEECFVRELKEELNINIKSKDVIPLCDYLNREFNTHRYVFFVKSDVDKNKITLSAGYPFL